MDVPVLPPHFVIISFFILFLAGCGTKTTDTTSDTTAPSNTTASNFINSGASSTSSTSVTLTISATDSEGVTGYYASETSTTPSASATGWTSITSATSYSASVSFTLSSGDATKTVYVWFKDAAGNVSASVNDTIELLTPASGVGTKFPIATTAQKEVGLSVAFDGTNYLVGMNGDSVSHANATAQLVSLSGSKVGSLLSTGRTAGKALVAFDGTNYLLVWDDTVSAVDMNQKTIYGQFVSTSGTNVGSMFQISSGATVKNIDAIVFDGTNYLVIWTDDRKTLPNDPEATPGAWDIYGQLVSKSGTLVGANFKISGTAGKNGAVAFDGTNYLVIWNEDVYDTDVNGKLISKSGTAASAEFVVNANSYPSDNHLAVAFDGTNYLAVWPDEVSTGNWDLFGQLIDKSGNKVGSAITVSNAAVAHIPTIAFDGTNYLVTWTDMRNDANNNITCDAGEGTCWDIYGQYVSKSGTLVGSEFVINNDSDNQVGGVVGFNGGKYFVIVDTGIAPGTSGSSLDGGDVYGVFITP